MANNVLEFIKAALRNPMKVSTVFPTSTALAETLLAHADLARAERVVELGTGAGAITKHLLLRLNQKKSFLGVELDPKLVDFMRCEYPTVHFEAGPAENLPHWVPDNGVDVVVSSLPWSIFPDDVQEATVNAILKSLKPGGVFVTYICLHALFYPQAKPFVQRLNRGFKNVYRSPLEWRNIPPAYVFKSTKA